MTAQVIPLRRRATHPVAAWQLEEARAELAARRDEERAMSARCVPAMRRLELVVREHGPEAWRTWAGVAHELSRHAARWTGDEGDAA